MVTFRSAAPLMPTLRGYRLADLEIDLAGRRVMRGDNDLNVGGLSYDLLRYLVDQGERTVGFDELIERVWAPAVVNEETVTQRVKLLRQALGDDGRNPRYIRSVRGRGYQLCSAVQPIEQAGTAATPPHVPPRLWIAAGIAVLAALVIAAVWMARPAAPLRTATQDELMQRARYYAEIGQNDNNERAIALYEEALRDEPDNAAARIGLSRALSARMCLYNGKPESAQRGQALAEAVIAQTPNNSAAHAALAYSYDCRGYLDAAIGAYEKAIALDPTARVDSLASVANLYVSKGRLADALEDDVAAEKTGAKLRYLDLQISRCLDLLGFNAAAEQRYLRIFRLYPDNVYGNASWPRFLLVQGRYAEAEKALDEALRRPLHPQLYETAGELALVRGDAARAAEMFGKATALRPHQSLPRTLDLLYGAPSGDAGLAARAEAVASEATAPEDWVEVALLRRADHAGAIAALRRAVAGGFRDRAWLQTSPLFRPLAAEPAFADVIDTIERALVAERAKVLAAAWLPADLLTVKPATP